MSEPWRTLAEKLAATPAHEQGAFLEGYLTGRPDRDAIIKALKNADPMGPAPAARALHPSDPPISGT